MAKKSKTQKAKASAARAQKKLQQPDETSQEQEQISADLESKEKKIKIPFLSKDDSSQEAPKKAPKEVKKPAKKSRLQFLKDVQGELRRVTWPSRQDVIRWSGVVLAALVFFGLYIFILDNGVVTPILVAISGLGA